LSLSDNLSLTGIRDLETPVCSKVCGSIIIRP